LSEEKGAGVPDSAVTSRGDDSPQEAETGARCAAIREQLERILASTAFRTSKRYSSFLRYIVDQTLEGQGENLKERTIGVRVFGREADYDTNQDHVVRSAAGEIRKRLAQYYQGSAHASEIRIEVFPGSYIPQFQFPTEAPMEVVEGPESVEQAAPAPRSAGGWWRLVHWAAFASVFAAGALAALLATATLSGNSQRELERFWRPVATPAMPLFLCVGAAHEPPVTPAAGSAAPQSYQMPSLGDLRAMTHQKIHAEDAVALAKLAGAARSQGAKIQILTAPATTLDDLREGSVVLVGAGNNIWTQRLTSSLRFHIEAGEGGVFRFEFRDKQQGAQASWRPILSNPLGRVSTDYVVVKDYAIVARFRSSDTAQMTVVAAGLTGYGTIAAGEFLTNPAYLKELEARAPADWNGKNIEAVLSTDVINGIAGPPAIVAYHYW